MLYSHRPFSHRLWLAFVASLCCMASALAAKKVIFALPNENQDPFWQVVVNGCRDASATLGIELEILPYTPESITDEKNVLDLALSQPSSATVIVMYRQTPELIAALHRSQTPDHILQIINAGESALAKSDLKANFIGMNDYVAGFTMGQELIKLAPRKILFISHLPQDTSVSKARYSGLNSALPSTEVVYLNTSGTATKNPIDTIKHALRKHGDIDTIVTLGPKSLHHLVETLGLNADSNTVYNITTFDLTLEIADLMLAGKLLFTIDQQPYLQGYYAVANASLFADYRLHPFGSFLTGPTIVYPHDILSIYPYIGVSR